MSPTTPSPEHERTILIERDFDLPPDVLFLAFSAPEHLKAWFGPPGYPLTLCEMDFRVGGRFRFGMTGPDGVAGPVFGGEYLIIDPPRLLKYAHRFELPKAQRMEVTISFERRGAQTHLTQRTVFETVEMKEEHARMGYVQGVGAGLDQLARYAASPSQR